MKRQNPHLHGAQGPAGPPGPTGVTSGLRSLGVEYKDEMGGELSDRGLQRQLAKQQLAKQQLMMGAAISQTTGGAVSNKYKLSDLR